MNADARLPHRRGAVAARSPPDAGGFTLIEVLITTAVTVVALTGLATVQMLALRSVTSSLQRSQATALAYEMVDRMRLNRGASGTPQVTALDGGYDNRTLCAALRRDNDTQECAVSAMSTLTGSDAVSLDLRAWWTAIDNSGLPHWYAGIIRNDQTFTVSVQWDDARAQDQGETATTTRASCLGSPMPTAMQEVCVMTQL